MLQHRSRQMWREMSWGLFFPLSRCEVQARRTALATLIETAFLRQNTSSLLLLSNTIISENQVPRDPKLKPHSISFCAHSSLSAILAARDWFRVPLWRESFFCLLFPKAAQLPGCDSLLWEGPISSPGNRVIREYQFQTYATKAKFSSDLLRWEGLQLNILCCFTAWAVLPSPERIVCSEAIL